MQRTIECFYPGKSFPAISVTGTRCALNCKHCSGRYLSGMILLLGESGTGKELLARALHESSNRSKKRFVAINCAAIPDNLLKSELFGYERGAFTGATKQTPGRIETAHHGTLFLDEIGYLPQPLQAKLLRFLQERVIERIGGREEIPVDVRIICATHQNLPGKIQDGSFREDLYYRIREITIKIPSVKERDGDALVLAKSFLNRFCQEQGRAIRGFDKEAVASIESYDWPGNVREIESRVKRAIIMAESAYITPEDLELEPAGAEPAPLNLKQVREEAELRAIQRALLTADDNISEEGAPTAAVSELRETVDRPATDRAACCAATTDRSPPLG